MIKNNAAVPLIKNYKLQQTLILFSSIVFLVIYSKINKLLFLYDTIKLNIFITSLVPDFIFIFLFSIILFVSYKLALKVIIHLLTAFFILLTITEHTSFIATGTAPNWYMYQYSLYNMFMLKDVLASEINILTWILLLPGLTLVIISFFIDKNITIKSLKISNNKKYRYLIFLLVMIIIVFTTYNHYTKTRDITANSILTKNAVLNLSSEIFASTYSFFMQKPHDKITSQNQENIKNIINNPTSLAKNTNYMGHNLVFIILESTRSRSLKPYNSQFDTMPFLTKLAKLGATVEKAHTVTSHTSKALVPIICGVYPKIDPNITEAQPKSIPVKCLPELLVEQNYKTAFFQSADPGFEKRITLLKNFGFQNYITKNNLTNPIYDKSSYFGYEDKAMLTHIEEYLTRVKQPFFLSILTLTSHHNYRVPKNFKAKNWLDQKILNNYLNTLAYTDEFISAVFDLFNNQDYLKNTLFVIVGDHGEAFGEHGRMQHDTVIYQEGHEIPMILVGPGIHSSSKIKGVRQTIDLFPTVLNMLGFDINNNHSPGKNLFTTEGHNEIFLSCWYKNYCMAIRQGDWKVIYHYNRQSPEIFNLDQDPLEKNNLIQQNNLPFELNTMIAKLQLWEQNTNLLYNMYSMEQKNKL